MVMLFIKYRGFTYESEPLLVLTEEDACSVWLFYTIQTSMLRFFFFSMFKSLVVFTYLYTAIFRDEQTWGTKFNISVSHLGFFNVFDIWYLSSIYAGNLGNFHPINDIFDASIPLCYSHVAVTCILSYVEPMQW